MLFHSAITDDELRIKIRQGNISVGGNTKLKIYGTLQCKSGKRMKKENRVFFDSEKEAIKNDYRPCGHCMKRKYKRWKHQQNRVSSFVTLILSLVISISLLAFI